MGVGVNVFDREVERTGVKEKGKTGKEAVIYRGRNV